MHVKKKRRRSLEHGRLNSMKKSKLEALKLPWTEGTTDEEEVKTTVIEFNPEKIILMEHESLSKTIIKGHIQRWPFGESD